MDNTIINPAQMGNTQVYETAANANSVNGDVTTKQGETKKRSYKPQPVYLILRKSRQLFKWQLKKDGQSKIDCIKAALAANPSVYSDALRFELDFRAERDCLTDSKRFCIACENLGQVPQNVADHVVFEGKSVVNKVLKEGLQVLGENVRMFNESLWADSQKLYKKEVVNE